MDNHPSAISNLLLMPCWLVIGINCDGNMSNTKYPTQHHLGGWYKRMVSVGRMEEIKLFHGKRSEQGEKGGQLGSVVGLVII